MFQQVFLSNDKTGGRTIDKPSNIGLTVVKTERTRQVTRETTRKTVGWTTEQTTGLTSVRATKKAMEQTAGQQTSNRSFN